MHMKTAVEKVTRVRGPAMGMLGQAAVMLRCAIKLQISPDIYKWLTIFTQKFCLFQEDMLSVEGEGEKE